MAAQYIFLFIESSSSPTEANLFAREILKIPFVFQQEKRLTKFSLCWFNGSYFPLRQP